jgi:REP element-mobilizing transposase RayT
MNRGIARRTVFETPADVRYFLALLARAHRKGWIELHAYSIMATHFHLLVRSVDGRLSESMRWVMNQYVRYFNRTRRRDGPLMRGRFKSKPVRSWLYLLTLIRYIDQNAVDAGLVAHPRAYRHGSARWLRQTGRRPLWLSRGVVDGILGERAPALAHTAAYDKVFAPRLSPRQQDWIERRLDGRAAGFDDLDSLLGTSERVLAWAQHKARLADGTRPGIVVVDPKSAMRVVESTSANLADLQACPRSGRRRPALGLMRVALLRDAAGESFINIARRLGMSPSTRKKQYRLHAESMDTSDYAEAYAALISDAVRALHGDLVGPRKT